MNRRVVLVLAVLGCGEVKNADIDAPPGNDSGGSDSGGIDSPPGFPTITGVDVGPGIVDVGKQLAMTCNATDPDGDALTFTWTTSLGLIVGTGPQVMLDARFKDGDAMVACTVDDGKGGTDSEMKTVAISLPRDLLVAYYPFSGDGNDASGGGHNITIGSGALTVDRLNRPNSALRIVAGSTGFALPDPPVFNFPDTYTIALFASCDDVGIQRALLAKGANFGNYAITTLANQNGRAQFAYQTAAGNFSIAATPASTPFGPNQIHVAVTFANGTVATFVNGTQVAISSNAPPPALNTMPVIIGGGQALNSWLGTLDEVRFYRRALSLAEIQAIATSTLH